ncbi:hypothetical protein [Gilvibacter sp.]|uniref:hypothetical protein n=1 Tax=Gilvibacter sp. TaxID=2729997 RepID=UPI0035BE6B5B
MRLIERPDGSRTQRIVLLYVTSVLLLAIFWILDNTPTIDTWINQEAERDAYWGNFIYFAYAVIKYAILAVGVIIPIMVSFLLVSNRKD